MIAAINKEFIVCFSPSDCTPELHLTFDSDFSDMSGKSTVAVNRVSLRNNSAIFNGDGELRVWRFSGGYIGNQLMLKMRFKPTHFYQQKQLLVGNCKKNTTMSYGAMIDIKSREVVMSITTSNGTADIKIHFKVCHNIYTINILFSIEDLTVIEKTYIKP